MPVVSKGKLTKIMVYIKPYDQSVYENFFVFTKTIQKLEQKFNISFEISVS